MKPNIALTATTLIVNKLKQDSNMRILWVDTSIQYPIYGNLTESPLFNNSYDVSLPLAFVYLRSFIQSQREDVTFSYFPTRLKAARGESLDIVDDIAAADLVVTSCSTADSGSAKEILTLAKNAGKQTAIGGTFARFSSKRIMEWNVVDFCVTGEGETPFLQIVNHLSGIETAPKPWPGVCTPQDPRYKKAPNCDLSQLPQPNYSNLPIQEFRKYMNSANILATRGCPAPCHFCTSARVYGFSYRMRPISSVVQEVCDLHELGFKKITLADDTVAVNRSWALDLFRALETSNPGVKFKVRSRADELDEELINAMVAAGVEIIQFGVESISLNVRESMHKSLDKKAIDTAFELILSQPKLKANPLYMLGYLGETVKDLHENAEFIKSYGSDNRVITYVSFTTPYPDTGFANLCKRGKGLVITNDLKYYTNKFPVFLPGSLCDQGLPTALDRLVSTYNDIADTVNLSHHTQYPIPDTFFEEIDLSGMEPI